MDDIVGRMVAQLRAEWALETTTFKERGTIQTKLGLSGRCNRLLPTAQNEAHARSGARPCEIEEPLGLGAQITLLRSCGSPHKVMAAGLASYANFCPFQTSPSCRPLQNTRTSGSRHSRRWGTFLNYARHLRRGRKVAGRDVSWGN